MKGRGRRWRGGEGRGEEVEGRRWRGEEVEGGGGGGEGRGEEVEGPVGDTAGDAEMERTGAAKREKLER